MVVCIMFRMRLVQTQRKPALTMTKSSTIQQIDRNKQTFWITVTCMPTNQNKIMLVYCIKWRIGGEEYAQY